MEIFLAKSAGYCFGVQKAIETVENAISKYSSPIHTLGPIIHNNQVIEKLENDGVYSVDDLNPIDDGVIIIRSHGVQPTIYEQIKAKNLELVDATCPYVKIIQKKVKKYYDTGYQIVIVGNKEHPEVVGVNGWCNETAIIIESTEQAQNIDHYKKICIVAQTTINQEKFSRVVSKIVLKSREIIIFNTICNATIERQDETKKLSEIVEAMIIVGGYHSSNTQKLVSIAKEYCNNTFHIETYKDLSLSKLKQYNKIGITAGASTPDWIIKEVIEEMEKEMNNPNEQIDFKDSLEETMMEIKTEDIVVGEVITVSPEEVMINIGYKSDGIIAKNEFAEGKDIPLSELIQPGDKIEVMVLSLNDGEGNVVLSKKRVDEIKSAEKIKSSFENEEIMNGKIKKSIKGGFIVDLGVKEVFMPISQYHIKYIKDPESAVGEDVVGKIIEYDPRKNRIIFSQRVVLEKEIKEKKEKVFNSLEEGKTITGVVKSIVKFGAFIDLGGVDGLIHISDLSWERVNKPEDVLSIGDTIAAMVVEVDREKEKVRLSLKQLVEEPWAKVFKNHSVGDKVTVKIVKLTTFGAFAQIIPGVEGLIHISQISYNSVDNVEDFLNPGEEVEVQIIDMDNNKRKIGLSMIALQEKPIKKIEKDEAVYKEEHGLTLGDVFGNLFKEEK